MRGKAPLGVRLLATLERGPDWDRITEDDLIAFRDATNRKRAAKPARLITGFPDRGATISQREIDLPDRRLLVRIHRPKRADAALPLVVQFHGGGFVAGTAAQCDWVNSQVAARCPAVVVSVEYRLAPEHPLPEPVEDGYDVLTRIIRDAAEWGIDPERVAVMGESAGGTIAALVAQRARDARLPLRAQVLVNPCLDWTGSLLDYPSSVENADNPTLPLPAVRAYRRFSLPPTVDERTVSPSMAGNLGGLAPALIQTAQLDPLEDHGVRYADRLLAAGTETRLVRYPRATHGFVSTPRVVPAAKPARAAILAFLRAHLSPSASDPTSGVPVSTGPDGAAGRGGTA